MQNAAESVQQTYDRIAEHYDDLWSRHVRGPQDRLTQALQLGRGERIADLACGTGVDSIEMGRRVAPGEVVGVDPSEGMLRAARRQAAAAGVALTAVCAGAEVFVAEAEPASFDAVSLRFCLAYLDWREVLPQIGRLLRPGGRVGILTSLATSAPQAWSVYVEMAEELGVEVAAPNVPRSADEVAEALSRGGISVQERWIDRFRLEFSSGVEAARWLCDSGYAAHPALDAVPAEARAPLLEAFGSRFERFRTSTSGLVPLDLEVAALVARRG